MLIWKRFKSLFTKQNVEKEPKVSSNEIATFDVLTTSGRRVEVELALTPARAEALHEVQAVCQSLGISVFTLMNAMNMPPIEGISSARTSSIRKG